MQTLNKERIADPVEDDTITQDQADAIYAQMDNCNGTSGSKDGLKLELYDGSSSSSQNGNGFNR